MRKSLVVGLSGTVAIASLIACGDKKAPVAPQPATVDAGSYVTAPPVVDAGAPTEDAGAADAGLVLNTDSVADTAIDLAIQTAAAKVAPKMDKEGTTVHATVKEGEHFGMGVQLQPGRCYTIVGFAAPTGVTQLNLALLAVPLNTDAGHSNAADKTMPVIGKGTTPLCPILPIAIPYKIDAHAVKGAGRIGIQVFSRAK